VKVSVLRVLRKIILFGVIWMVIRGDGLRLGWVFFL